MQSPDTRPRRCDYLVDGALGFKSTHVLMLLGAALLGAGAFAEQLDESDVEIATFQARKFCVHSHPWWHRRFIIGIFEFYRLVNNFVRPRPSGRTREENPSPSCDADALRVRFLVRRSYRA